MAETNARDREVLCDVLTEAGRRGGDGAVPIAAYREEIVREAQQAWEDERDVYKRDLAALKARVSELEAEVERVRTACNEAHAVIERQNLEVARLRDSDADAPLAIAEAEAERDEARAELATINGSKSPCGHWAAHAMTSDGGKHIECLECTVERLRAIAEKVTEEQDSPQKHIHWHGEQGDLDSDLGVDHA